MNHAGPKPAQPLSQLLAAAGKHRLAGKRLALILFALLIAAGAYAWLRGNGEEAGPRYQTEAVERGRLVVTVAATGNLQPTNQVDVGSELSGTVQAVWVDDNARVRQGQELARLDVAKLVDQIARARAALESAEAGVRQAAATLAEAGASLARLEEVARLSGGKVPARAELEIAQATRARAEANLAAARAAVAQARAALRSDETNLAKASIRSPIDGVVLARRVEPGQTVAASLQAPVLFTLAEDLAQMELQVKVDEADVGQVRAGQAARFTVDAWPGRKYPARVTRVSYGAQTNEGVVSYLTTLKVENDDLSLRPGMTASAEITAAVREDVLLVPNAALRFSPAREDKQQARPDGIMAFIAPPMPRGTSGRAANGKGTGKRVWVLIDGRPAAVPVKIGQGNGRQTEILAGELRPGAQVIVDSVGAGR